MSTFTPYNLLLIMATLLFLLGMGSFVSGILTLALRAGGKDVQTLANQTAHLAQKGMAEDVAGLVGNASALLNAMNQLTRTTAGIGIFLTLLGMLLMGVACWLAIQISMMRL